MVRFLYTAHDTPYSENESLYLFHHHLIVTFILTALLLILLSSHTVDYVLVYVGHVDFNINENEVDAVRWVDEETLKSMLANGLLLTDSSHSFLPFLFHYIVFYFFLFHRA